MRQRNARTSNGEVRRMPQNNISSRSREAAEQYSPAHSFLETNYPKAAQYGPHQRSNAAARHQQTHTQHSRLTLIESGWPDRKHSLAEYWEQHPIRAHQTQASLHKSCYSQSAIFPNIADAFTDGRKSGEIPDCPRKQILPVRL